MWDIKFKIISPFLFKIPGLMLSHQTWSVILLKSQQSTCDATDWGQGDKVSDEGFNDKHINVS